MVWNLRTIFLAVGVIASILAVIRTFWDPSKTNHDLLLGLYLIVVSLCSIGSIHRAAKLRGGLLGTCLFGIAYFLFVLQAGFGLETVNDSRALARNTVLGFSLLGVAFLASQLLTALVWPACDECTRNRPLKVTIDKDDQESLDGRTLDE